MGATVCAHGAAGALCSLPSPLRKRRHWADSTRPRTASVVLAVGLYFASARPPRQLGVDVYDYCEYL